MFKDKLELGKATQLDETIHRVFKQNTDGAKLLEHWNQNILMSVSLKPDPYQLAWTAGVEAWVKQINAAIAKVEDK